MNKANTIDRIIAFILDVIIIYFINYFFTNFYVIINTFFDEKYFVNSFFLFLTSFLIIPCLYFGYFHSREGQTLGMKFMKIKMLDAEGWKLSFTKASLRTLVFIILYLGSYDIFISFGIPALLSVALYSIFIFGLIYSIFNKSRQTFVDFLFHNYYFEEKELSQIKHSSDMIYVENRNKGWFSYFLVHSLDSIIVLYFLLALNYLMNTALNPVLYFLPFNFNSSILNFFLLVGLFPIFYYFYSLNNFVQTLAQYLCKSKPENLAIHENLIKGLIYTYIYLIIVLLIIYFIL